MNSKSYVFANCKSSVKLNRLISALLFLTLIISFPRCTKEQSDITVPSIVSVYPENDKTAVSTFVTLSVSFSEKMDSTTISNKSFTLKSGSSVVNGTVTYTGTTATFKPDAELEGNTLYTGTVVAGVMDLGGNIIDSNFTWSFTTGPVIDTKAPAITAVTPAASATSVSTTGKITVTFDEEVKSETVSASSFLLKRGSTIVTGTLSIAGKTVTFTPAVELVSGTMYSVTVTKDVKDAAGNPMTADYSWSFTTLGDIVAPVISSVSPQANATGVQTNVRPSVTFSEAIDQATVTASTFNLKRGTTIINSTLSVSGNNATLVPSAVLAGNTLYTVTLTRGIKDIAGNPVASDHSWSFTTGSVNDVTAPTVTTVTPLANSTNIPASVKPSVTFNELMDPVTITTSTFLVKQGTAAVTGTISISGNTATFSPSSALAGNTVYSVTITTGVRDKSGNAMASAYTWTFTTVSASPVAKSFASDVVPILNQCNTCHTHNWTPSSTPSTFHANLVNSGHINLTTPTNGKIYSKVNSGHPSSVITAEQKATVLTWIKEGSKNN